MPLLYTNAGRRCSTTSRGRPRSHPPRGGSSDFARLTSPGVSPAKSRTHHEEEEKKKEEEASNWAPPPVRDIEMQDPPQDEEAAQEVPVSGDVPPIEARM